MPDRRIGAPERDSSYGECRIFAGDGITLKRVIPAAELHGRDAVDMTRGPACAPKRGDFLLPQVGRRNKRSRKEEDE